MDPAIQPDRSKMAPPAPVVAPPADEAPVASAAPKTREATLPNLDTEDDEMAMDPGTEETLTKGNRAETAEAVGTASEVTTTMKTNLKASSRRSFEALAPPTGTLSTNSEIVSPGPALVADENVPSPETEVLTTVVRSGTDSVKGTWDELSNGPLPHGNGLLVETPSMPGNEYRLSQQYVPHSGASSFEPLQNSFQDSPSSVVPLSTSAPLDSFDSFSETIASASAQNKNTKKISLQLPVRLSTE
ncbi:hypothetical protein CF319_g9527 [Tilletia indica]|nr:hypothetical protein CF319_g9527 [Tilletia indica]